MGIVERREREKEQRRNDIVDAAERVFFERGVETATMEDVATEAELAKATLYLYFRSKDELYASILARGSHILHDMFVAAVAKREDGISKVEDIGRAYIDFFRQYPDYFDAMIYFESKDVISDGECFEACQEWGDKTMAVFVGAVSAGIADGTIRKDLDPGQTAIILWAQTTGLLQILTMKSEHLEKQYELKSDDLIEAHFELVGQALSGARK